MRTVAVFTVLVLGSGACVAERERTPDASVSREENEAALLEVDYQAFDQTPGGGWRELSDRGEYVEAAELIDAYLEASDDLDAGQRVNLTFHAGQAYAFADSTELALHRFRAALVDTEPAGSPVRWNAYVRATIAFLENDRSMLTAMREEIAAGPDIQGVIPNLDIVDQLLAGLSGSYAEAYQPDAS